MHYIIINCVNNLIKHLKYKIYYIQIDTNTYRLRFQFMHTFILNTRSGRSKWTAKMFKEILPSKSISGVTHSSVIQPLVTFWKIFFRVAPVILVRVISISCLYVMFRGRVYSPGSAKPLPASHDWLATDFAICYN